MSVRSEGCRRSLDRKSDLFTTLNAYKQKHNTSHEGTAALELHIYHDNFGATPRYKREKPKTLSVKRGRQAFIVNGYILLSKSLPGFKTTLYRLSLFRVSFCRAVFGFLEAFKASKKALSRSFHVR